MILCLRMARILLLFGVITTTSAFLDSIRISTKSNCLVNEFACNNGKCIPSSSRCNEINDCGDGSDEEACDLILCKEPIFFRCKNKRCISKSFVCDGEDDCRDLSDELDCSSEIFTPVKCKKNEWQCSDKKECIPYDWVCNGEPDCADKSDEGIGCTSKIPCDGFKCDNGHCVPKEWVCDGNDDCKDKSDEQDCERHFNMQSCVLDQNKFLCADNKTCIDIEKTCDIRHDCPDQSDEGPICSMRSLLCANQNCSHGCVLLPTGPKCLCPKGHSHIDGRNCKDINECEEYGICDQKCRNTPGSYECYCDPKYVLQDDKRTCKAEGGEALMVFSMKNEIRAYTLRSQLYYPVGKHLRQVVGVDYDGHHIYWTDVFAEHESIVRSVEDGSEKELLVTSGLGLPEDLAVDWLTGNIYFTDAEKVHIGVCTGTGEHCTVLLNKDIRKPRGIVLNVALGDMYWTDWGEPAEIAYSLMDGSEARSFLSEDIHWPNGLALDYPNQRLYWTDAKKMTLESIRLDGTDRRVILQSVVKHPYAIAVFESNLYWSDWATHSIQSCDKFFGKNHHTIIKESKNYIYGIDIFHSALHTDRENPCEKAFCSDICLLKGSKYSCACPQDKVLSFDRHVCRKVERKQMLVLGYNDVLVQVQHQLLGKHDVSIIPSTAKNIGCLAFNSVNNSLLISDLDSRKIITVDLKTGFTKSLDIHGLGKITAMEFDPMGNNLYMCDEEKAIVEVVSLRTLSRKTLLHDMQSEIPEAIALLPEEGVMFISLRKPGGLSAHIDRLAMDGTGRTHTVEEGLVGPISIYYDRDVHRVFFADAGTGNIESTSAEGDDRHGFRSLSTYPIGLASLNYDLFWVNEYSKKLYWAEKNISTNYNKRITLDIPDGIKKLHLISTTPKKRLSSACHANNGGCSHLCLMSYKSVVCACPVGYKLATNNLDCIKRERCSDTEFLCPDSNKCVLQSLRCNGHNDCSFGEDERDCEPAQKCAFDQFQCTNGVCIDQSKRCDYNYDCKDKSDEDRCDRQKCLPFHFQCEDGTCVHDYLVCNGAPDCEDASDEENCMSHTCGPEYFRCNGGGCIPATWECDRDYDCSDFSDEHPGCATFTCPPSHHTCANGQCIEKRLVCDHFDDCDDHSDELNCKKVLKQNCGVDEFACSSNVSICLLNSARCNGTSECPHHEDEKNCSDCNVEEFTCKNKKCIPVEWLCDGVDDCGDNTDEEGDLCTHPADTAVSVIRTSCDNGFRCNSGHCIPLSSACDGKHDCYDNSDEGGLCSSACNSTTHPCSHKCLPTPTGPMCQCNTGYKLVGDGRTCEDINECHIEPPVCSQLCSNKEGSHVCDCFEGYLLRSDKRSCKAEGSPLSIIFTAENQIRRLTQKTNSLNVIFNNDAPKITGLDTTSKSEMVFFSIEEAGSIHRINEKTLLREYIEHVGQPQKLTVDWVTRNVYFYNASAQSKSISVCNFEEMLCARLIPVDPHRQVSALAVDAVNRVLFYVLTSWWVFKSPSYVVYKCNLDGSQPMELINFSKGYVTDLAFDFNKKRLYFADQQNSHISTVDYEGKSKALIFTTETRPIGLKFFEDHLFYLTNGGYVFKCKLFDNRLCESFKLSRSDDLFTVVQDSLQPALENVCRNHSCTHLCLPSDKQYRCLCRDGTMVGKSEKCSKDEETAEDVLKFQVYSVSAAARELKTEKSSGAVILSILIPILLILMATTAVIMIKRRSNKAFNVSIRFHNPESSAKSLPNDGRQLLQPGQHEYVNPINFVEDRTDMTQQLIPRGLNEMDNI